MTQFDDNSTDLSEAEPMAEDKAADVCFFGGDISFEAPEEYDDIPDKKKDIRSVFSMMHFSLFVYLLASQGSSMLILLFASLFFVASTVDALSVNADFLLGLNAVCQYLIAFPIFILLCRGVKRNTHAVKTKICAKSFWVFIVTAEGVMLLGALIASLLSRLFDGMLGISSDSVIDGMLTSSNPWVVFVCVCILAPIFEELIFRKILIDRLSTFGDGIAIVFSAVAFGLFHGNITQFIYATAVGIILGYLYTLTRRIEYTVVLHAILNFLGGLVPMGVEWIEGESQRLHNLAKEGQQINTALVSLYDMLILSYNILMILFMVAAVVAIVIAFVKKKIRIKKCEDYDSATVVKTGIFNAGSVLFIALSLVLMLISLLSI